MQKEVIYISEIRLKTSVTYKGTGSQTQYDFPFDYLRKSFIKVTIDDVLQDTSDYTVDNRSILFNTAPAADSIIVIYRETDTERLVSWADASVLKASDMTISQVQQLHILEEGQDWSKLNSIYLDETDKSWEGNNHKIKNVSYPVNDDDVVTKGYMETVQGGFVMTNTALKDEATKQAGIATTKASEASASASAAATSETNAASSANIAKRWAEASDSPDNTTSKSAKTWASEASTSANAAKASETNAKISETNAKSSETKAANSATTATEKAGIATTKASEASTSASAAKTSETNAQNAASAAASSQADAANSAAEAAGAAALITFPIAIENGGTGANNASQACANISALPTSGGTITGAIAFDIDKQIEFDSSNIKKVTNDGYMRIVGGTDGTSAGIILCGKDCILDDYPNNGKGLFILDATSTEENTAPWFGNGTDVSRLIGSPNGSLLWNGKEIERVSEIGDNYIRYENGIQIIFFNCSYTSSSTNITFPKPFINDDYILNMTSLTNGYPIVISRTTTSFTFTGRKAGTSSDSVSVGSSFFYVAIGKWK